MSKTLGNSTLVKQVTVLISISVKVEQEEMGEEFTEQKGACLDMKRLILLGMLRWTPEGRTQAGEAVCLPWLMHHVPTDLFPASCEGSPFPAGPP